jgi:glycosyltransferase-like protein
VTGARSVGLFTYSSLPRGSVVHTAHLADALCDLGWDVTVYALDKDGRGFFRPLRAKLKLIRAAPAPPTTRGLVALRAREVADFLVAAPYIHDIHHAQDCLSASGLLEARARGVHMHLARTVHHVERFHDPDLNACQKRSIRQADLRFTVSDMSRRDIEASFGVAAVVVGNGVDAARFRTVDTARVAAWRERLVGPGPIVLAVGGVEARKNTLAVLLAFVRLHEHHPAARLCIVGGATVLDHGVYRAAFDACLARLPAAARTAVVELGVVAEADMPALFRLADVLAAPSLHEGFGLVALEALAAGLPLVASARPPFDEFLDPSCAVLVDPLSVDDIAAGLRRALASADRLARAGRRHARAYAWSRVAARHVAHYETVIHTPRTHARDALRSSLA